MLTASDKNLLHTLNQSGHAHCREAIRLIEHLDRTADRLRDQVEAMTTERQFLVARCDALHAKLNDLIALAVRTPVLVACASCHRTDCGGECLG